jgi:hypothetical protein
MFKMILLHYKKIITRIILEEVAERGRLRKIINHEV